MDITKNRALVITGGIAVVLLIAVCLYFAAEGSKKFKAECAEMGGRVDSETQTSQSYGTYMGSNGKMMTGNHTTTTTTTYCLSKTGGILAIK